MKQKTSLINLTLVSFIFLIIVCGCNLDDNKYSPNQTKDSGSSRSTTDKPPVTKAQAEQIKFGMSREEVYRILGSEGDLWFESDKENRKYDVRIWQGTEPKKGLKVSFSNDKVIDVKFNVE